MEPPRKPRDDSAKRLRELAEGDKKAKREPKESADELQECDAVFADF